jgi:hypothetical protein
MMGRGAARWLCRVRVARVGAVGWGMAAALAWGCAMGKANIGRDSVLRCAGDGRRAVRDLGWRAGVGLASGLYPELSRELSGVVLRAWRADCLYDAARQACGVGDGWRAWRALALAFRAECLLIQALRNLRGVAGLRAWGGWGGMRWGSWAWHCLSEAAERSTAMLFSLGEYPGGAGRECIPAWRALRYARRRGVAGLCVGVAGPLRGCLYWGGASR